MIPGDMLTEAQRRCIPDVSFELIPIRNLVSNQEYVLSNDLCIL